LLPDFLRPIDNRQNKRHREQVAGRKQQNYPWQTQPWQRRNHHHGQQHDEDGHAGNA
jgi:hypothetical protein